MTLLGLRVSSTCLVYLRELLGRKRTDCATQIIQDALPISRSFIAPAESLCVQDHIFTGSKD